MRQDNYQDLFRSLKNQLHKGEITFDQYVVKKKVFKQMIKDKKEVKG